jgi:cytoskeletal protein RodZ
VDNFEYNFDLLKVTREKKKISAQSIAADLCLSERHIISIEQNSVQYFPSSCLKYTSLKNTLQHLD